MIRGALLGAGALATAALVAGCGGTTAAAGSCSTRIASTHQHAAAYRSAATRASHDLALRTTNADSSSTVTLTVTIPPTPAQAACLASYRHDRSIARLCGAGPQAPASVPSLAPGASRAARAAADLASQHNVERRQATLAFHAVAAAPTCFSSSLVAQAHRYLGQ